MFKSLSVRWKIYIIAIVSLLGFAAYLLFNVWVNQNNAQILKNIRDSHYPTLSYVQSARELMDRIDEQFNTSVVISDEDYIYSAEEGAEKFAKLLDQASELKPQDAETLQKIKAQFSEYVVKSSEIGMGMIEGTADFAKIGEQALEKQEVFNQATADLDEYIEFAYNKFSAAVEEANNNSRILLRSGLVIWAINVLIIAVTSYAIAKLILTNIVNVSTSLSEIAEGGSNLDKTIPVKSKDEIGDLAVSFNQLMVKLREKTNDLVSMMHNMHQGLFTIYVVDNKPIIHPEYSTYIEKIFETTEVAGRDYRDLMLKSATLGTDSIDQMTTAIDAILKEDEMMFEFNSHLLPDEMVVQFPGDDDEQLSEKILEIDWDPIVADGVVDKVMVTVRDVTELRKAAKAAEAQKEELEIIGQILQLAPSKFKAFLSSAYDMLSTNRQLIEQNKNKHLHVVADLFVNMHTIKGNSRTYGFDRITDVVHDTETTYDRLRKEEDFAWSQEQLLTELDMVTQAIDRYKNIHAEKLDFSDGEDSAGDGIQLDEQQYDSLLTDLNTLCGIKDRSDQDAVMRCKSLLEKVGGDAFTNVISGLTAGLPEIAENLGKPAPTVAILDNGISIRKPFQETMVNVFTHLLRNSLDHGIEEAAERKTKGKPEAGTINIELKPEGAGAILTISDDGRGLAIKRLRGKAAEAGKTELAESGSLQDIANVLFESGVSTAETVSDISGRGVGMDAVKKFLQSKGADIAIIVAPDCADDVEFAPFHISIDLPDGMCIQNHGN